MFPVRDHLAQRCLPPLEGESLARQINFSLVHWMLRSSRSVAGRPWSAMELLSSRSVRGGSLATAPDTAIEACEAQGPQAFAMAVPYDVGTLMNVLSTSV